MATRTVDLPPETVFNRTPRKVDQPSVSDKTHSVVKSSVGPDKHGVNKFDHREAPDANPVSSGIREFQSTTWLWIVVVPVAVWFVIILLVPSFVKTSTGNPNELDHASVLLWTLVITLIIWILFFGFAKCKTC